MTIWVVDNNSKDDTESGVREIQSEAAIQCCYIKETNQGLSHARNAGICAGTGEIIGFIDDYEEIDENWYEVVEREFAGQSTPFIAGTCVPNWAAPPPAWLPPASYAAIAVTAPMNRSPFGENLGSNYGVATPSYGAARSNAPVCFPPSTAAARRAP